MDNLNILAALAGALPRCRPFAGNGHAARPAPCIASCQHTHDGLNGQSTWNLSVAETALTADFRQGGTSVQSGFRRLSNSYGPSIDNLQRAMSGCAGLIRTFRSYGLATEGTSRRSEVPSLTQSSPMLLRIPGAG